MPLAFSGAPRGNKKVNIDLIQVNVCIRPYFPLSPLPVSPSKASPQACHLSKSFLGRTPSPPSPLSTKFLPLRQKEITHFPHQAFLENLYPLAE